MKVSRIAWAVVETASLSQKNWSVAAVVRLRRKVRTGVAATAVKVRQTDSEAEVVKVHQTVWAAADGFAT